MAEEIGKIEKPPAENFAGRRKLFLVPLLFSGKEAPQDFVGKFERYWDEVREQIEKLEEKLGKVSRTYHETIFIGGKEGMKILEKLNPKSYEITKSKSEGGKCLQATENSDLAQESTDWERCLMVAFSEKVRGKVSEFYLESSRKRYEHIARTIDETLKEGEIGVLFIREGHRVQFPSDLEIFNIYPPALDEINRWLRDYPGGQVEGQDSSKS